MNITRRTAAKGLFASAAGGLLLDRNSRALGADAPKTAEELFREMQKDPLGVSPSIAYERTLLGPRTIQGKQVKQTSVPFEPRAMAGNAAALAVKHHVDPRGIDIAELQALPQSQGVDLHE